MVGVAPGHYDGTQMPDLSVKVSGRLLKARDGDLGVLPLERARNSHGNIADQVRNFGEVRGTDTNRYTAHPTGGHPRRARHDIESCSRGGHRRRSRSERAAQ